MPPLVTLATQIRAVGWCADNGPVRRPSRDKAILMVVVSAPGMDDLHSPPPPTHLPLYLGWPSAPLRSPRQKPRWTKTQNKTTPPLSNAPTTITPMQDATPPIVINLPKRPNHMFLLLLLQLRCSALYPNPHNLSHIPWSKE